MVHARPRHKAAPGRKGASDGSGLERKLFLSFAGAYTYSTGATGRACRGQGPWAVASARVMRPHRPRGGATVAGMQELLRNYLPILIFLGIAVAISGVMVLASVIVARQRPDPEKLSAYECGFDAFGDARNKFDVRYYLVAILFIIFDLEVAFLFPWAVTLGKIGVFGFWSMIAFLGVLTVGFIYEWKKGALEWE